MSIRLVYIICVATCSILLHGQTSKDAIVFQTIWHTFSIENRYADTHMCFYHGVSKHAYIAMLANTYLDHIYNKTSLSDDFIKLRVDNDLYHGAQVLHDYLHLGINDRCTPYKNELLSVNLSLPGNIHNFTESVLHYFKQDTNNALDTSLLSYIAHAYCDDPHVCRQVIDIMEQKLNDVSDFPCGVIMQVCIPHAIVPSCVYISRGCGIPHTMALQDPTYSHHVLQAYQNNQQGLHALLQKEQRDFHAKGLQARIRLDADIFAQPGCVMIYAYHGMPHDMERELYDRLYHACVAT